MQAPSLLREGRTTVALAIPLIIGQLSQMLMAVTDTLMIGRLGVVPLAASTFANSLLHVPFMFGIGMCMAVSIRVSQARGARDPAAARGALRHGLFLSLVIGVITLAGSALLVPWLPLFQQKPEVVNEVPTYLLLVAASMIPANGALTVKSHADAMNRPWPAFWIMLGGVGLNVVLNWFFIFGHWGAPRLELAGAGLATLLARIVTLAALIWWSVRTPHFREWVPYHWFRKPDWAAVRHLVKIGLPASLQLLAEVGAFVFAILMIGTLGVNALASHQVAISCAATVFMVPLGLSMALTVQIGEAYGAKAHYRLRPILVSAWLLSLAFTLFSAQAFLFFNEAIAGWFLTDSDAMKVAAGLLLVAAAFQTGDALQIVSSGALRGLDDVKGPAWITFAIYWGLSLPIGWVFAFPLGAGVNGIWWGFTIGLTLNALALGLRAWRKTREDRFEPSAPSEPETVEDAPVLAVT